MRLRDSHRFISLLLLIVPFTTFGRVINDEEIWLSVNSTLRLSSKWQVYIESTQLFFDYSKYKGVDVYRLALGRTIGKELSLWGGYASLDFHHRSASKFPTKDFTENRPYLQLLHSKFLSKWKFTNRFRYEIRRFRSADETSERVRSFHRIQYMVKSPHFAVAIWDEYFWNLSSTSPGPESRAGAIRSGFNQNLAFIGVAVFFGDEQQHMVETGYMNNYVNGLNADRSAHVWMTTISGSF